MRISGEAILRYLDGALGKEEVADLNKEMQTNTSLRREFADLLLQHVQLSEMAKEMASERLASQRGAARQARLGEAGPGEVRLGKAWRGRVRRGEGFFNHPTERIPKCQRN